jgi:hypothetical protein
VRKARPSVWSPTFRLRTHHEPEIGTDRGGRESGYAAIDALVALTLLASTLVFGIAGADQGLRAARAGLEVRQANDLIQHLLEASRAGQQSSSGMTALFAWELVVDGPVKSASAASLCTRTVTVRHLRTHRAYSARTDEICLAEAE